MKFQSQQISILLLNPHPGKPTYANPDLGLGYLASSLRSKGYGVAIIDQLNSGLSLQSLLSRIVSSDPDIIGIKVYTRDVQQVKRITGKIKEMLPQKIIVLGGPHMSCDEPAVSMRYFEAADYAFIGEAESAFPALIASLKNGSLDKTIPGLIYREDDRICFNTPSFLQELDTLLFPAWDLMNPNCYKLGFHIMTTDLPAAPLITSRGCPFGCTFCCSHKIMGKKVRRRSVSSVIEEIKFLKLTFGVRTIDIVDEDFAVSREYVMEFCQRLLKDRVAIRWSCPRGIRLDNLDAGMIKKMEEAGCFHFSVGIESGSENILTAIKKQTSIDMISKKLNLIKRYSQIKVSGHFIMGFPGETEAEINKTIDLALQLPLYYASFYPLLLFPGTEIYQRLLMEKKIAPDYFYMEFADIDNALNICSAVENKKFKALFMRAWALFYFRPRILLNILKILFSRSGTILFLRAGGKIRYFFFHAMRKNNGAI